MVGRRSSAGFARRARTPSLSQIQWRRASATKMVEMEGIGITGGNGFIDPHKAIEKLKLHGASLWGMQIAVALLMTTIAVIAGERVYSWSGFVSLTILGVCRLTTRSPYSLGVNFDGRSLVRDAFGHGNTFSFFNGIEPNSDRSISFR